jgi:outer membrane receptor protein involved in Fe transport
MKLRIASLFIFLLCSASVVLAQTGKIDGTVVDSRTNQPLIGVNVIIEGTFLGAATNLEGHFSILNVPPGSHTVRASMIGYNPVTVVDVRVSINQTTNLDIELRETAFEMEEVVIVAQRPIVQRDVSASITSIDAQTIENIPVQNITQVLTLQAGIERGSEGIIIRGGGAREVGFMVDGLSLNDERSNIPYAAISLSSLQEIQIQTGGFNAEYGNIRSGIVNVVTQEGSTERYSARAIFHYGPAAPKNFGPSLYAPDSYFNRPFTDPAVMWVGTANGDWDSYTRSQYPSFEGWNVISEASLADGNPSTDLTPEQAYRIWQWHRRRDGNINKPDYVIDVGFGGPVPFLSNNLGNMRFYATFFEERDMFVFPLSRDSYTERHSQVRITSNITPSMKLSVTGLYGEVHSVSPYDWTTTPTGRVLRSQSEVANIANSAAIVYMPGYFSPSSVYRTMIGARFTNAISPQTFYEVRFQYNLNKYNTFKIEDRDTTRQYEIFPGYFVDESPWGYMGYAQASIDGMSLGGWMNLGRDKTENSTTSFNFDITSQITTNHQVKTGLHFTYNDYRIRSSTESPSMDTWTRSMVYNVYPFRVGAYIQDKMEYGGFIANIGLRLDYSDPNMDWYELNRFDQYYQPGYGNRIEEEAERKPIDPFWSLSPRLGISHPITENSKLYFNYGHFRSEPTSSLRFRMQREYNGLVTFIGNPALELEKTIAYELGYEQNLLDMFLVRLAAYYKDISDQPGWIYYRSFDGSVQYRVPENNNYADIRGFELTVEKRAGSWISGFINYTYDVRTSGYFGLLQYYEDPTEQRNYNRLNPTQSRPVPQPFARANVNVRTPHDFGPEFAGMKPAASWLISILADWRSGSYETYNPDNIPGVQNNVQWRDWFNVDLRLAKDFSMMGYGLQFFLDVSNVFNIKYMSVAGFSDTYDYTDYLESLRFPWRDGVKKGNDRIGDYRPWNVPYDPLEANPNNDPEIAARNAERIDNKSYIDNPNIRALTFLNPRKYTFGIRINL